MRNKVLIVVRRTVFWLGLAALVTLVVRTMFFQGTPSAPTEAEARRVLAEHVTALGTGPSKEAYCAGDEDYADCIDHWEDAGGDAARPVAPPVVMAFRGGGVVSILDVCGKDGLGRRYVNRLRFDMVDGVPAALDRVYWLNRIRDSLPPLPPQCR